MVVNNNSSGCLRNDDHRTLNHLIAPGSRFGARFRLLNSGLWCGLYWCLFSWFCSRLGLLRNLFQRSIDCYLCSIVELIGDFFYWFSDGFGDVLCSLFGGILGCCLGWFPGGCLSFALPLRPQWLCLLMAWSLPPLSFLRPDQSQSRTFLPQLPPRHRPWRLRRRSFSTSTSRCRT